MKCYACDSLSVIQDGMQWTCAEHIQPCKCGQNHSAGFEWDFQQRLGGISYTIKAMESEQPDKHDTDHQSGEGRN